VVILTIPIAKMAGINADNMPKFSIMLTGIKTLTAQDFIL
jgi:hypothetical protein